jgi:3-hydroxyacyl-[acyl-carrier-protein] dehydratase
MRFLLIDKITAWKPGETARAVKNVALSEDFFEDHFPLKPIMPGVLIVEGIAQLAGLLVEEGMRERSGRNVKALMSIIEKAKFRKPVYPGDSIEYEASVLSMNESGAKVSGRAAVGGELVAECSVVFSFHDFSSPRLEARRNDVLAFWLRGLATHEDA